MIVAEIGAELGQLADAVERLAMYVGERKQITAEDVDKVVATTRQRSVFELANAVGAGDRAPALAMLSSMLGARESGVRIVAMLARHLRQLWITSELLQRTRDKFEIASALGIPPFFADDIIRQARTLDAAQAKRMHAALYHRGQEPEVVAARRRTSIGNADSRADDERQLARDALTRWRG